MARLIVIGGFAGAGKSTVAKRIGATFAFPVYEIDHVARSIRNSEDFHGASGEAYGIAFDLFFSLTLHHLRNGCSVILDQNMGHIRTWQNVEKLRSSLPESEITIFILDCPYEVCLSRVETRTNHPNQAEVTMDELHKHKWKWKFLMENEFPGAIRIDATRSQQVVFDEVMGYLLGGYLQSESFVKW